LLVIISVEKSRKPIYDISILYFTVSFKLKENCPFSFEVANLKSSLSATAVAIIVALSRGIFKESVIIPVTNWV
jgi:hypothetical protein